MISGHRPGGRHTGGYANARFGNPCPGTRLLLDMGRTVAVISVRINLGEVYGTGFQPRAGTKRALPEKADRGEPGAHHDPERPAFPPSTGAGRNRQARWVRPFEREWLAGAAPRLASRLMPLEALVDSET